MLPRAAPELPQKTGGAFWKTGGAAKWCNSRCQKTRDENMEPQRADQRDRHRRTNLTDRALRGLKPAAAGARYEIIDAVQPSLAVRVTDKGAVSFVLRARFPGRAHFTRNALGAYPTLSLVNAREKARAWLRLIGEGKDPATRSQGRGQTQPRGRAQTPEGYLRLCRRALHH
jgi:Arm DNA-binding domain